VSKRKKRGKDDEEGDAPNGEGQANQLARKQEIIKTERERISTLPAVILNESERSGMPPHMLLRTAKLVGDSPLGKRRREKGRGRGINKRE
jgi:hypothetical protein